MMKKEFYCNYCDGEFVIEAFSVTSVNYCPNCGTESLKEDEIDSDDYDDDGWED